MKRTFLSLCLLPLAALVLTAQDAGMVLRTSVTYNTQKATLPLSEEQRKQADQLAREAQAANQAGKYGDALRSLYHGLAVMRKIPWTPAMEFASSLQGKVDHAMVEPGGKVQVTLSKLYDTPNASGLQLNARLALAPVKKEGGQTPAAEIPLGTTAKVDPSAIPFRASVNLPAAATGDFALEVQLTASGEDPAAARGPFLKSIPVHIEKLAEAVQNLRARVAKAPKQYGISTAEYAVAEYEHADAGELNPANVNFREEFGAANAIVDALNAGKDPFAGKHGDSHRAYRSEVDGKLQPYRIFVPESYGESKAIPLLVALHGMGGDENSLFDSYDHGLLKREAERVGFLVLCPKGRDSASMYRGTAEQDVLDAMADVEHEYHVDPNRIYLMGHSMGGYGTWSIAMNHPGLFAALGPISGGGQAAGMVKIHQIPAYVVHGDDDRTVAVTQSRTMVEAGKKAGATIVYVEVPGGSHTSVAAPAFAGMLDFFAKQKKGSSSQ